MTARIIHFGPDDCHRMTVLRSAGYAVEECGSLLQLRELLATERKLEAVLISDGEGVSPHEAVAVARAHCSLPLVLFRSANMAFEDSGFDLVVHCLTPPEIWLTDVDTLIERSRSALRI